MLKYLLLIVLAGIVWWRWRNRARPGNPLPRREAPPEPMVNCAACGLYLPRSDGIAEGSQYYCCEAHRRAGQGARSS